MPVRRCRAEYLPAQSAQWVRFKVLASAAVPKPLGDEVTNEHTPSASVLLASPRFRIIMMIGEVTGVCQEQNRPA